MRAVADTRGEMHAKRLHQIKDGFMVCCVLVMVMNLDTDTLLGIVAICQVSRIILGLVNLARVTPPYTKIKV